MVSLLVECASGASGSGGSTQILRLLHATVLPVLTPAHPHTLSLPSMLTSLVGAAEAVELLQDQRGAHPPHGERRHFCGARDFAVRAVCCSGARHRAARRGAGAGEHTQPSSHHTERGLALTLTTTHTQARLQALARWRSSGRLAGADRGGGEPTAREATQQDAAHCMLIGAAEGQPVHTLERSVNDEWRSVHSVCIHRT